MRPTFWLAAALLAPLLLIGAVILYFFQPGPPADVRATLAQFEQRRISAFAAPGSGLFVRAQRPRAFTPAMSGGSFGDGYFQTTYTSYDQPLLLTPAAVSGPVAVASQAFVERSGRALPYPPSDLWCVFNPQPAQPGNRVLFVAAYGDLYVTRWIVHQLPAALSAAELDALLNQIGCRPPAGAP